VAERGPPVVAADHRGGVGTPPAEVGMSSRLLKWYHRLPSPLRSAAASLRGWYLNRWRYGADSEALRDEAQEREQWTAAQWHRWREARLAYVLHRAATRVPFYRDQWAARRRRGDRASWDLLANWPVLAKDTLRANPEAFVAEDCDIRKLMHGQTSGTTGTPIHVWQSRATLARLYAIAETRTRKWDGIPATARWARLGGQLVTPVLQRRPPFWVWNVAMRQLYMSSYHLAPDLIPHYLDALRRYKIVYLAGYSSSIHALAQQIVRYGRRDLTMQAVYTNAEPLDQEQRRTIGQAFQCPVRETYGMVETVAAASECPAGRLHQWPEVGHIEVEQESSELICTGLLNPDMPLIRYRVGDRGRLASAGLQCECGRSLPVISHIEGRTDDLLVTPDGRAIGRLSQVGKGIVGLRESQIIQEERDLLRVLVALAPGYALDYASTLTERVRERMGDVRVVVQQVDTIPRTRNGKLRAVVCNLPSQERAPFREQPTALA
jgi:phenylacetate-CoA ligase